MNIYEHLRSCVRHMQRIFKCVLFREDEKVNKTEKHD